MHLLERFWAMAVSVMNIVSFSSLQDVVDNQSPLLLPSEVGVHLNAERYPVFYAPGAHEKEPILCEYPTMVGWEYCSTPTNRECWLKTTSGSKQYDIHTNYEDDRPIGITRNYTLELNDGSWDADGLNFTAAKLFNNLYPGPWIQACWGDTLRINVTNNLRSNGTSVHWHGVRQNQSNPMDGVNGVTQCPIAPGDHFVYEFNVTQYGSSWYHSHYSVQYADGSLGPMTFHGPSSAEWDDAISPPLIMTDWGHNTAFDAVTTGLELPDILLNGWGNVTRYNNSIPNTTAIHEPYNITFDKPQTGKPIKKYLLRLINTSFTRTFVFSIDNHRLQIASADFVAIHPYYNTSLLLGIGQRYNVIVEANPLAYNDTSPLPKEGNYWMRTYIIACGGPLTNSPGYERNGILRYDSSSKADPSSQPWQGVADDCRDEAYTSLTPMVPWQVDPPKTIPSGDQFDLQLNQSLPDPPFPLAQWAMDVKTSFVPIRISYTNLTIFNLDNTGGWDPLWRIIPEDLTSKDWVYLAIIGPTVNIGAHPIHLHGHDFAILEQAYDKPFSTSNLTLKFDNPPRRDVVLVPRSGYVVMAFKADNPGPWLVHCHIAFHIARGLGMQILERESDANKLWPKDGPILEEAARVCQNWEYWYDNTNNWAEPPDDCSFSEKDFCFQEDSGI